MVGFPRFKRPGGIIGLELHSEGLAVVACSASESQPAARHMEFLRYEKSPEDRNLLKQWVSRHHCDNYLCNVVLAQDNYQILLVEPPDVPTEELRSAIRWRLKDLISIPLEQAVIDVFALPDDGIRANKKMVYVVASDKSRIENVIRMVRDAGLALNAIDIGELALRNIAIRLNRDENTANRGVAVARLRPGNGSLYIYRQSNMYLARNFTLGYDGGLLDDIPVDALALELQRSVDYFERQMGQAPPSSIYICGENISEEKVNASLKSSLGIKIEYLDPASAITIEGHADGELLQICVGALGGAMRQDKVA